MPIAEQHVLFFGGLVRGAIAWAQVRACERRNKPTGKTLSRYLGAHYLEEEPYKCILECSTMVHDGVDGKP